MRPPDRPAAYFDKFPDYPSKALFVRPNQPGEAVPLFADCVVEWGFPRPPDAPPESLSAPRDVTKFYDQVGGQYHQDDMRNFCADRHGRAANAAFADGSGRRIRLDDLWGLKWSNEFRPGGGQPPSRLPAR